MGFERPHPGIGTLVNAVAEAGETMAARKRLACPLASLFRSLEPFQHLEAELVGAAVTGARQRAHPGQNR